MSLYYTPTEPNMPLSIILGTLGVLIMLRTPILYLIAWTISEIQWWRAKRRNLI